MLHNVTKRNETRRNNRLISKTTGTKKKHPNEQNHRDETTQTGETSETRKNETKSARLMGNRVA